MKTRYFILTVLAALALSSCNKLLDVPRKGVIDYDTYYKTDDEIESAGITMYSDVRGWYYNVMLVKNIISDDYFAGGAAHGDNVDMDALGEFGFNSETGQIEGSFTGYYGLIYHANVIIGHIDPAQSKAAAQAVAEAHLFRAWAYFELTTLWGNPPIVDHELVPSEYKQPNGSTEDLWKLIEDDLTYAVNSGALARKTSQNDATTWRVTKEFGQALLGKAYLWMAWELNDKSYYRKSADMLGPVREHPRERPGQPVRQLRLLRCHGELAQLRFRDDHPGRCVLHRRLGLHGPDRGSAGHVRALRGQGQLPSYPDPEDL